MEISFSPLAKFNATAKTNKGALVLLIPDGPQPDWLKSFEKATGGLVKKALSGSRFEAKKKQVLGVVAPQGLSFDQLVLIGMGETKKLTAVDFEQLGGAMIGELNRLGAKQALVVGDSGASKVDAAKAAAHIGIGAEMRSYRFDKYFTKQKESDKPTLQKVVIAAANVKAAQAAFDDHAPVLEAVKFTRDLISEPANVVHPESFAETCKTLTKFGLQVEVMGEAQLKKLGAGALLGVGQGSIRESKMVVMRWNGGAKKEQPIAFIGKGVCFDTGGISIKPSAGMEDMKWDMGGAGVVTGLMRALAARKAKVNAIGIIGLVENMPDGNAQRPGDVVTSMSGQTIEVINTDAEGRLVLADCLWYCQREYKPKFMIDLATLTGAILIALGYSRAGMFTESDELAARLQDVAAQVGEPVWRMPLGEEYDGMINSDIADVKNVGEGRYAGSTTAAHFLKRFTNDVPWVHLDIAGTVWAPKAYANTPKGATGYGVRLLDALVREYYEK
jgi:leucyl aminopeptidase